MRKLNKLFAMLVAMLGVGTLSAQTDVTSTYLTNADLSSLDGWTRSDYTDYKTDGDANVIEFYHTWSANAGAAIGNQKDFYFKQTVTLPAGEYRIAVNAFYREGNGNGTNTKAYIFAGEQQQYIVGLGSSGVASYTGSNDLYKAANAFSLGDFSNAFDFTVEEESSMELGFSGYIDTYCSWCILGPLKLYQYSMDDFNNELTAARTNLQGVTGLNTAMTTKVKAVLSETESVTQTKAAILEATAKVNEMYDEAIVMQTAISDANTTIAACESMLTNSTADDKSAFSTAISTAKSDLDVAEDETAIASLLSTLNEAKKAYCLVANPAEGYPFDMTHLVVNPQFDEGTTGWVSNTGAPNNGIANNQGGAITGPYFENWQSGSYTGEIYQELTDLPKGKYGLTVAAFRDQLIDGGSDADAVYVFANEETTLVNAATPALYSVEVFTITGTIRFGVQSKVALYRWMGIDNVSLIYYGFDVTEAQSEVAHLKTQAESLVAKPMDATVLAALNTAISNANVESTDKDELSSMISALQSAYDAAVPSVDLYATVLPYITKAEAIDASIATDYRTQYDNGTISESAETVFQNLEVATYNYVTKNFEYPVALSDTWNSTGTNTQAATFSNEHWSGETREYKNQDDSNGQGWSASTWDIDFDQEVTLPAGEYVFKVAGRKSEGTTLELVVTQGETTLGTVNDFPSSNNSLGINKAGAASFDAEDSAGFARDGVGYGWQWRYVRFELADEATVKVAVHAEADTVHQWVSFGDYTLQMTEETYLEANKGGVEAAEAAAQALVDTIPMGDAEKEALSKALAMTYTTGAEMLAKVEALETAVANANAWLTAYNGAKAPLVAALERFEADYNDGENGAKDHMAKSRWETVLAMVQAATEAKDVTNSYDGFAAATENLVAALDSATVSVNEYADLKKAIDAANALAAVEVNWGDEPFQRPESAKDGLDTTDEQALYDAAEADGEGVTSVTGALNAAMDITLNVPATGDAYYITVATAGHAYEGYPIVATSGSTGDNNPTGYGYTANATDATATKLYTFTQVEGNLYNISFEMNGETVYMTYGSLNGSAADWKNSQIQGNTDVTKAGKFEIEASTTTEGAIKICNTVTGTYLDCQADGPIYTDGALTNEEFALIEQNTQLSASINISSENQLSTCVLQFDAALPDGLEAYVGTSVENGCLILEQVTGTLSAYTPCLLYAENGATETLSGTIVMNGYAHKVTVDSLLYGAIEAYTITEGYVLQNQGEGAKFHTVGEQTVTIPAGKCWLSVPQSSETDATPAAVSLRFTNGGATKLNPVLMDKTVQDGAIYTIDGKRVERMERGQIYIINGQKVMIK